MNREDVAQRIIYLFVLSGILTLFLEYHPVSSDSPYIQNLFNVGLGMFIASLMVFILARMLKGKRGKE